MLTSFLPPFNEDPTIRTFLESSPDPIAGRETVRIIAVGSRRGVLTLIHTLHKLGFAEATAWSKLLPAPDRGEVMSILTWHVWVE